MSGLLVFRQDQCHSDRLESQYLNVLIPPDFIDELLARTDIVEIVDSRISLKKTGQNYTGLCPFHSEKTASFSVSGDKQFYYCFGCQASGSAIKFVMEFDRLDFIATIELLAGRAGMEVPQSDTRESPDKQQKRKSIYNLLDQSAGFYGEQLRHHSSRERAVSYLKSRGLSGKIARDFGLGFAPPGWDHLYSNLAKTNHERQLLIDSGMVIEKKAEDATELQENGVEDESAGQGCEKRREKESRVYDRFRDRIMFPIRDLRGRVIAFGGRIIGDGKPKYLNSPETPVFHKGRELYGLYEARQRNRKLVHLLVVEGYMDVVALAQHGVNNAVATLGTATTSHHLDRLYRMVSKIVFCFDGDTAGKNAAWKALLIAMTHMKDGRSARFLFVPDDEDPDSLIRKEGKDQFEWRLDQAQYLPDFFFDKLSGEVDVTSIDGKAQLSKTAMPSIMSIPTGVFRELMIGRLSEITGLSTDKLLLLAGEQRPIRPRYQAMQEEPSMPFENNDDYSPDEYDDQYANYPSDGMRSSELADKAISLLLRQPELAVNIAITDYTHLETAAGCGLLLEIIRTILAEEICSPAVLLGCYQERVEFSQLRQLAEQEQLLDVSELPEEYLGVIRALNKKFAIESNEEIKRKLLSKPLSDLSEVEKQQLRELTRIKRR